VCVSHTAQHTFTQGSRAHVTRVTAGLLKIRIVSQHVPRGGKP